MPVHQPTLAELASRHLSRAAGAGVVPDTVGEVELYDVVTAFRTEPQTAWTETNLIMKLLGQSGSMPKMPANWASHVRSQAAAGLVPMAVGYFPQQVSDLSNLVAGMTQSRPKRLAFGTTPDLNDQATARWEAGDTAEAVGLWQQLPDSAIKSFNLGVASFSAGDTATAGGYFREAASALPETSGWKHLAAIYAALTE